MQQENRSVHVNIILILDVCLRFGIWAILFQAESIAGTWLTKAPPTVVFYYASFAIAFVFIGLIRFAGPSRLVADIQELCVYDAMVQLVGLMMFNHGSPNTSATLALLSDMVLLAKVVRLLWPISVLPDQQVSGWPVFGVLGLLRGSTWVKVPEPKWHQRRSVIYAGLVACIPLGYGMNALATQYHIATLPYLMFTLTLFGLQPLLRWLKRLEEDRSTAIAQEKAAQAKILELEKDRAMHFANMADQLSTANAAHLALVARLRKNNELVLHANHDIMQPMFWLDSALQRAANETTEPNVLELLTKTLRASHEITEMISDVFHQVKLEDYEPGTQAQVLQVSQLAQYFWDRFYDLARVHQVKLAMGNEAFAVLANEPRLRRVIANLLNNAILYSGPGARVSLRFVRRYGACHVFVRNSGPGIADANHPDRASNTERLLALVALAHTPEKLRDPAMRPIGHGIGLHSTERVCAELGSPLLLRSRMGYGSVFYLRLPLA